MSAEALTPNSNNQPTPNPNLFGPNEPITRPPEWTRRPVVGLDIPYTPGSIESQLMGETAAFETGAEQPLHITRALATQAVGATVRRPEVTNEQTAGGHNPLSNEKLRHLHNLSLSPNPADIAEFGREYRALVATGEQGAFQGYRNAQVALRPEHIPGAQETPPQVATNADPQASNLVLHGLKLRNPVAFTRAYANMSPPEQRQFDIFEAQEYMRMRRTLTDATFKATGVTKPKPVWVRDPFYEPEVRPNNIQQRPSAAPVAQQRSSQYASVAVAERPVTQAPAAPPPRPEAFDQPVRVVAPPAHHIGREVFSSQALKQPSRTSRVFHKIRAALKRDPYA